MHNDIHVMQLLFSSDVDWILVLHDLYCFTASLNPPKLNKTSTIFIRRENMCFVRNLPSSFTNYSRLSFQNVYVNITRILTMAQRLCDAGHYAQNSIRIQAAKLEREWKSLAAALDDRSTVLSMSVMFHKKAETVSKKASVKCG